MSAGVWRHIYMPSASCSSHVRQPGGFDVLGNLSGPIQQVLFCGGMQAPEGHAAGGGEARPGLCMLSRRASAGRSGMIPFDEQNEELTWSLPRGKLGGEFREKLRESSGRSSPEGHLREDVREQLREKARESGNAGVAPRACQLQSLQLARPQHITSGAL